MSARRCLSSVGSRESNGRRRTVRERCPRERRSATTLLGRSCRFGPIRVFDRPDIRHCTRSFTAANATLDDATRAGSEGCTDLSDASREDAGRRGHCRSVDVVQGQAVDGTLAGRLTLLRHVTPGNSVERRPRPSSVCSHPSLPPLLRADTKKGTRKCMCCS